uniref:Uncharacterized protein n=1 Tax=Meloidogyne enterolobii TaxID=390850 RepID=A0A6V7WSN2_MELEN|nr:unnamed protein product [Meloidogyne enterolobii]
MSFTLGEKNLKKRQRHLQWFNERDARENVNWFLCGDFFEVQQLIFGIFCL